MSARLPKLIVFDLDFTLWDCGGTWCDCLCPPFRQSGGRILDREKRHVQLYREVPRILADCDRYGIVMALASRTEQPRWARQLVELLDLTHRFAYYEIYPSSKLRHFAALRAASGVAYSEMIFFDDELRNTREVSSLGVHCVDVPAGLDWALFQSALASFQAD